MTFEATKTALCQHIQVLGYGAVSSNAAGSIAYTHTHTSRAAHHSPGLANLTVFTRTLRFIQHAVQEVLPCSSCMRIPDTYNHQCAAKVHKHVYSSICIRTTIHYTLYTRVTRPLTVTVLHSAQLQRLL
jgi:hypothetical protein